MTLRSWDQKPTKKNLMPWLLGQDNIPKPLHGINPRTIMGDAAWAVLRHNVIFKEPYCHACGLDTLSLELHEDYIIDYNKKYLKIRQYVPLCKDCHMFIHSGLLTVYVNQGKVSRDQASNILKRGFDLCRNNNVSVFAGTINLANALKIDTSNLLKSSPKPYYWDNWYLEYEGKKFKGLTEKQWKAKYNGK